LTPLQAAEPPPLALKAARLLPVNGEPIPEGTILLAQGRIAALGTDVAIPEGAEVRELPGRVIVPGFIDAHGYLSGYYERDEALDAFTPDLRMVDVFDPSDQRLAQHLAAGITTALLAPGNGNVAGGCTALVKLAGASWEDGVLRAEAGLKLSFSAEALRSNRYPTSYAGLFDLLQHRLAEIATAPNETPTEARPARLKLRAGQEGEEGQETGKAEPSATQATTEVPTWEPQRETLRRVLQGELALHAHAVQAHEIMDAVRLAEEFGLRPVLFHADRAYEVVGVLGNLKWPVVCGPLRLADDRKVLENPAQLAAAGIPLAFCTDAPLSDPESLRRSAVLAAMYGLPRAAALRALTLGAAEILGVADRLGSLEVGKDADLVVFNGDPLDLTSRVEMVVVGGRVAYER